ncbi:hypothetical protein HAHE_35290 [Haloferula helveola]|uniref:Prepilin-type N-terminal cleavage/methylation domain-containing protein n=1 Tax=Haloferula helveola TaxID=490095 RepID=A0ABM7RQL0_9BACT|nr:hypothetical protein HAHE_35290 [Haloferula helveola]
MFNPSKTHTGHRTGFTLIELLVVLVIVAALSAITFVVAQKVRAAGKDATCISNLRQLAMIAESTAAETGYYPPMLSQTTNENGGSSHVGDAFPGIIRGMECGQCPAAKYTGLDKNNNPITSYGSNPMVMVYTKDRTPAPVRPAQIRRPSEVYLMADSAQHGPPNTRSLGFSARWYGQREGDPDDAGKPLTTAEIPSGGFWDADVSTMPMRHNGHANVVFCDGHVESISDISELRQKNFYWNY